MNRCILHGRVGSDVHFDKVGEKLTSLAKFKLPTEKRYKGKKETSWHSILCWGKLADIAKTYLSQGVEVIVEGEITYSQYEKNGEKVWATQITASSIEFCGRKRTTGEPVVEDDFEPPF